MGTGADMEDIFRLLRGCNEEKIVGVLFAAKLLTTSELLTEQSQHFLHEMYSLISPVFLLKMIDDPTPLIPVAGRNCGWCEFSFCQCSMVVESPSAHTLIVYTMSSRSSYIYRTTAELLNWLR